MLSDLDKEKLIKIIIDQSQQIGSLLDKIEQLEKASKRQAAPFRVKESRRRPHKKRAGAKKGHQGHYRHVSGPIDAHEEVPLPCCPQCSGPVSMLKPVRQVIEELTLRPYRLALTTYKGKCSNCGHVHSTHPMQSSHAVGSAGCHLGKQAIATALLLNHRYGMTKRKVSSLFTEHFGLPLSIGGLVQMQHRMADGFSEAYQALGQQASQSEVLHSDETSWYIGKPQGWLWTFTNPDMTYYRVDERRNREVIETVIGKEYRGVLVSDCLVIYDDVCAQQQKCYAHHLKAIATALEQAPESNYLKAWRQLLKDAIALKGQRKNLTTDAYQDSTVKLAIRAAELFRQPRASPIEEKIHKRLEKQQDHLFVFLRHPLVPATNNLAERSLRPAVVHRKVSCGNKTRKGADTWQILASVIATNDKQDTVPFEQKVEAVIKKRLHTR